MTNPDTDRLEQELALAWSHYQQLAARVAPSQQTGVGRRTPPASRPPLDTAMVSHMHELRQYLAWWNRQGRYLLNPVTKVELTQRTGVRCPHCGADLIAWLRPADPAASEIVCTGLDHLDTAPSAPRRWPESEWKRLGVLAGVHEDGRFGARLHAVGET